MALIPPFYIDCVVAIGTTIDNKKYWLGTGFLFGKFLKKSEDGKHEHYRVYLVTNKHVIENKQTIQIRFNPKTDQPARDYSVHLTDKDNNLIWTGHPDPEIDVAVVEIDINKIKEEGMKFSFFQSQKHIADKKKLMEVGAMEGDFVFVLGFPMGIVAEDRQHVFVRNGTIARIHDLYEKRSKDFVVDALVFPGNSGGPVISKPEIVGIEGTKFSNEANLIGMVKSYIPYTDVAISQQTNQPRITFEENSGLSKVEPIDHVIETIEEAEKKKNALQYIGI